MTQYDRNNLSSLVSENLPDFVTEDYPKFVVFLEEYYKWLESRDNAYFAPLSLNGLVDIDRTVDDFIKHFKSYIFPKFPERFKSVKGDELDTRLTIKKIRDFYQSKGTKDSIKFLIRLFFDVYSEILNNDLACVKVSSLRQRGQGCALWTTISGNRNNGTRLYFDALRI